MIQIKILSNTPQLLEPAINEFLYSIRKPSNVDIKLIDIKYIHEPIKHMDQAMIIYNISNTPVQPKNSSIQVKIIANKSQLLEPAINEFLYTIGSTKGMFIKLLDIKYLHEPVKHMDQAMIIYTVTEAPAPSPKQPPTKR